MGICQLRNDRKRLVGAVGCYAACLGVAIALIAGDYDGDGIADPAAYQSYPGHWTILLSGAAYVPVTLIFGGIGFEPVCADYDGDGKTDIAVYERTSGTWRILMSGSGYAMTSGRLGGSGYWPVPGDYDGDGKADPAICRLADGNWTVCLSGSGYATASGQCGGSGYWPAPGDYDGDGRTDPTAYRLTDGNWVARLSGSGYSTVSGRFGGDGYWPAPGDYDGDGKTDLAVYRPCIGEWRMVLSSDQSFRILSDFGGTGWFAIPADYDGDGRSDPAVWVRSGVNLTWSIRESDGKGGLVTLTNCVPNFSAEAETRVDTLVAPTLIKDGPGVAVLVMLDFQPLVVKGYGYSDINARKPITANSVFDLASVSKQATAVAIIKLMETGMITPEYPVRAVLPDFIDYFEERPVKIADLLHHVSGLADYTSDDWTGTDDEFARLTLEDHLKWINKQEPVSQPGLRFEYNNSGYALLALVVQRLAGEEFWSAMGRYLFRPLGLTQTVIYHELGQPITNQVTGYIVEDGQVEISSFPTVIAGDGNMFSSIADMALYDNALRSGILMPTTGRKAAFSNGLLDNGQPISDQGEGYGYGWGITDAYVHHSGGWLGASSYYRYYIRQNLSIIVLSNDENYETEILANQIVNMLGNEKTGATSTPCRGSRGK